jgi:hypothetical protein
MSNVTSGNMMGTGSPSITQQEQREVGDEIRYLGIGQANFTSLIENMIVDNKTGNMKRGKGLISKRKVSSIRYEMYNRSPRTSKFTVASGTTITGGGVVLTSVVGLRPGFTLFNPRTSSRCRVETISTNTLTGTSFGATTFSCAADDILIGMAPAIPDGSTEAIIANGTDDNTFNTLQFSRLGVSASWVLQKVKQIAGGERLTREKMYLVWEFLADWERTLLFSDYSADVATKNTTTGTDSGWTGEFPTTKGLIALAANSYDMQGQLTFQKWRKNVPLAFSSGTINDNQDLIALCGNEVFGTLQDQFQEKHYNTEKEGILEKVGIKAYNTVTDGPNIKIIKDNNFNSGALRGTVAIFAPENLGYVSLEGADMTPNNNIQTNATHGRIDELYSYSGLETKDGGKSILIIQNCLPIA